MDSIQNRLEFVRANIATFAAKYQRQIDAICLIAVSKGHSADEVLAAIAAGQMQFGENYLQEASDKINTVNNPNVIWHYIGRIQSKKAKLIAKYFSWVQTIDSARIADLLNNASAENEKSLNVCIQVNISNEVSKAGVKPEEILPLAMHIASLPHLKLRGLMAIPEDLDDYLAQLEVFQALQAEFAKLQAAGFQLDTLSMGMSHDFEAAIAAGSTMIRIGTAIFGPRVTIKLNPCSLEF